MSNLLAELPGTVPYAIHANQIPLTRQMPFTLAKTRSYPRADLGSSRFHGNQNLASRPDRFFAVVGSSPPAYGSLSSVPRRARTALFRCILGAFRPLGARREIPNGNACRCNLVKPSD
jgi:hypothetical protein